MEICGLVADGLSLRAVQGSAYTAPSHKAGSKRDIENPSPHRVELVAVTNSESMQSPGMGPLAAGLNNSVFPMHVQSTPQGMPVTRERWAGVTDVDSPYAPNVRSRRSATPKLSESKFESKSPELVQPQPWYGAVQGAASRWFSGREA